ncbi:hypothetical protein vseg_009757 [Gypsophila vaccaria]
MVFKRYLGDEGSNKSLESDYSQTSTNKFQKVVKYVMEEAFVQQMVEKIAMRLEPTLRKVVKEELEHAVANSQSSLRRSSLVQQPETCPQREVQLQFTKKVHSPLFTNTRIRDEERNPLEVKLIDANSGNVVQDGELSSIKVEIVVLNGDFVADGRENWSANDFGLNIVGQRDGKRPLLVGGLGLKLVNGVASLENVNFTDNSSWIRSRKFKLGVRAVPCASVAGIDIKEAVSEAFKVLDHRGESYQKHSKPSLDDPVWRLMQISKHGPSHKKLESCGVKTVRDFLMRYNTNPLSLRQVLANGAANNKAANNKAWETMVRHANECHLDNTCYRFWGEFGNIELLFDCVYKLIAVKFTGHDYQSLDFLDTSQKVLVEKLKQIALQDETRLVPIHRSLVIPSLEQQTIGHNISFSSSQFDLQHGGFSTIDEDKPEKHVDFNLLDTASYPSTGAAEADYLPEHAEFCQPTFMMGSSSSVPADGVYNWFQNINEFGELAPHPQPQAAQLYPFGSTWGHDSNDHLTTSTLTAHYGRIPWQMPNYGVNASDSGSGGSFKAGWCKIRAAVMWKIVRRHAAAKRKAKFSFS